MTLRPARFAAMAGVATVLASGALVAVASAPALAADVAPVGYTCSVAGNSLPVFVQPTGTLPTELAANTPVPAGTLPLTLNFIVPRAVLDGLKGFGASKVGFGTSTFAYTIGTAPLPVSPLVAPNTAIPATGDLTLPVSGSNQPFTAPAAGTYDLNMPATITATVTTDSPALSSLPATCAITDPSTAKIGSVTTTGDAPPPPAMQSSTTAAKAPASVKKGKAVKVTVTVTSTLPSTGTVTAKEGAKTLGSAKLSSDKATITIKKLAVGTHKITVSYSGDTTTNASKSKVVKVKVLKPKKK